MRSLGNAATVFPVASGSAWGSRERFIGNPQVLVIDEGTANLDNETEAAIVSSLAGLRGEKTIIVVAHRLALVTRCDQVYYLRNGRLLRSGAFVDLVSTDPGFRQFAGTAA